MKTISLVLLASVLLISLPTSAARSTSFHDHPSNGSQGELPSDEYEYYGATGVLSSEVVNEFLNWNDMSIVKDRTDASLQYGQNGNTASESTYCSTWCMLKQSLGLTIVGLLLICIRLVLLHFEDSFQSANSCS